MKKKKFLVLLISLLTMLTISVSAMSILALGVTDKVSEVALTVVEPRAGESVNLVLSSVEAKHHMTYKVVGLRWYKNGDGKQMGVESDADTYFIGGNSYTVEVDLEVKSGNSGWNFEYTGVETDYSGISATINGKTATVKYPPLNADKHKTITVSYEFSYIADGIINYPSINIPTPIAGELYPDRESVQLANARATWIPTSEYLWYVYENNAWKKMAANEHFIAGARYKVELAIATLDGFRFNIESASDLRNDGNLYIWGYVNNKKISMRLKPYGNGYDDEIVFVDYEFTSCEAQYVDSVSFSNVVAPSATQHPQYNAPTMTGNYALLIDDEYTGGAQFNFVNGIQWNSVYGLLDANSVFEQGGVYSMTFFIKTFDTHRFTDWVDASANIGYVDVLTIPDDPTVAMVTITFAPCDGGVLNEVSVGGVTAPIHGEMPDYEFVYGQGYDKGTSNDAIVWYDLTDSKTMLPTSKFEYGHKYELRVILRSEKQMLGASMGKFEFASHDSLTVKVNGKVCEKLERYNNNPEANWVYATISFECEKATVSEVAVTVEEPSEGNTPAKQITKGSESFNIDGFMFVDSETDTILNQEDVYAGARLYRFVLLVSAAKGYKFDESVTLANINGQITSVVFADENSALIYMTFISNEAPYCLITFSAGEGSGSMDDIILKGSMLFVLPECEFEAPSGKHFIGWSNDFGLTILHGGSYYLDGVSTLSLMAVYEDDDANNHQHIYSPNYNASDEYSHYKTCVSPTCPEFGSYNTKSTAPGDEMMHQYDNDCDDTCNDCGFVRTTNNAGDPLHFYEHDCSEVCPNCGEERVGAAHTPNEGAICTEDKKCVVCQKVLEEAKDHTPGASATCTTPQTCTICGEELAPANGHSAGVEWITDENGHHKLCSCGEKVEVGAHVDENEDKICDVCGCDMKNGLPVWAIVLIIVGAVAVLGGGGFSLYWFVIKKKIRK